MTDRARRAAVDLARAAHSFYRVRWPGADRIRAVIAQMTVQPRLVSGLGKGMLPRSVVPSGLDRGERDALAGFRGSALAGRSGGTIGRAATMARPMALAREASVRRRVPAARTAAAPVMGGREGLRSVPGGSVFAVAQKALRIGGGASAGGIGAMAQMVAPVGPRMAAHVAVSADALRRAVPGRSSGVLDRGSQHIVAPSAQQATAPGFHRTVRQPQGTPAAGHVYLDKALVGYHLAAAITAEQTRSAARPNISGAGFNSSMAALRPSGAGR